MRTYLIWATILAFVQAEPLVGRIKKNNKDNLLPSFNFFGYTDLDALDFVTGAAERGYGRDVRENWNNCFAKLSISDEEARLLKAGIVSVLWNESLKWILGTDDDATTESLFPPECKDVADELDGLMMWVRGHYMAFAIPVGMYINALSNFSSESTEIFDFFSKILSHNFYGLGYETADLILTVIDGETKKESEE